MVYFLLSGKIWQGEKMMEKEKTRSGGEENKGPKENKLYDHLMEGVGNMLPFTVSGGIFIAIAFLIDSIGGAPQDAAFGTHLAAAAWFKTVGGYAFDLMIPVLAGHICMSIAGKPGFLVGMAGGAMAAAGSTFADPMGGVPSGFLGAMLAGFAGGWIMKRFVSLCSGMPKALEGIRTVLILPLGGLLTIGLVMCAVNPDMGLINRGLATVLNSIGSFRVLLGFIIAAMMSIDMGGPFNKAAYAFALQQLTDNPDTGMRLMASVMLGGMVPPIAIALCTVFFKSRWTEEERRSGPVNIVMGLSFVTEGAIPYAAADPGRVIPGCLIGAGTAGALSMLFGCTLQAPHGGIFVFPVVGRPLMYLLSLAGGSLMGMVMLAVLKKRRTQAGQAVE